jgi:hypothetical protein
MALYPLCAHNRPAEDAIQYATQTIAARVTETSARGDLLAALSIFGTLVYPDMDVLNLIGVELMHESKFVQEIQNDAAVQARLEQVRINVQQALDVRFGAGAGAEFTEALSGIQDLDQLSELLRLAIKSRGLAAFRRALSRVLGTNDVGS